VKDQGFVPAGDRNFGESRKAWTRFSNLGTRVVTPRSFKPQWARNPGASEKSNFAAVRSPSCAGQSGINPALCR
jgi:hypothetical protein